MRMTRRQFVHTGGTATATMFFPAVLCGNTRDAFLERRGTKLFLGGREYREIGYNVYQLLHSWYLGKDTSEQGDGMPRARRVLDELADLDCRIVRCMGPFWPKDFNNHFFDPDPAVQERKRRRFFDAFDAMLEDLRERDMRVVYSLMWNRSCLADLGHHSFREGLRNPASVGHQRFMEIAMVVVGRYATCPTIAMWEAPGNEWDLHTNIKWREGSIGGKPSGDELSPGPVVRDARNNYTARDLAQFYATAIAHVRRLDPRHLVTTGDSGEVPFHTQRVTRPRLLFGGRRRESLAEHAAHMRLLQQYADVSRRHHYLSRPFKSLPRMTVVPLDWHVELANQENKPFMVGEMGTHFERGDATVGGKIIEGGEYISQPSLSDLAGKLSDVVRLVVPVTLLWTYGSGDRDFRLQKGVTDEALAVIKDANQELKRK